MRRSKLRWQLLLGRKPGQLSLCALLIVFGVLGLTGPSSLPWLGQLDGSSKAGKTPAPTEEEETHSGKVATSAGACQRAQRRRTHAPVLVERVSTPRTLTLAVSTPARPSTERTRQNGVGGPLRC